MKPLKLTVSIDRFSMTFKVDENGKNYLSDDFLFRVSYRLITQCKNPKTKTS